MIENAEKAGLSEIMVHNTVCLYKIDDSNWYGKLYGETTFKELLQNIKKSWVLFTDTKRMGVFSWQGV